MANDGKVWVDAERCTGCGACIEVCPVEAIVLVEGKARIDEESCTGCEACIELCPQEAIQPIIEAQVISVPKQPPPAVYQPGPLASRVAATVAAVGAGLLVEVVRAAARLLDRWLSGIGAEPRSTASGRVTGGGDRAGQRSRHRWRGG